MPNFSSEEMNLRSAIYRMLSKSTLIIVCSRQVIGTTCKLLQQGFAIARWTGSTTTQPANLSLNSDLLSASDPRITTGQNNNAASQNQNTCYINTPGPNTSSFICFVNIYFVQLQSLGQSTSGLRVSLALTVATKSSLATSTSALDDKIDHLGDKIDHLGDKLIIFLQERTLRKNSVISWI